MPAYNYYHHERMRVCLHAYAMLDNGSTCSTDLPRCGTSSWNQRKACHCAEWGAITCLRFHGSAKISSYIFTVDHRPRTDDYEWISFLHGTMEPHPKIVVITASIVFHDSWNQVEPRGTKNKAPDKLVLPYSCVLDV